MYTAVVVLLMGILPLASLLIEMAAMNNQAPLIDSAGKWFVFWAVGMRLFTAGLRQIVRPGLTSEGILGIEGKEAWQLVRELGFANVGIGLIAIVSLWQPGWRSAAALAGGLFLVLAGLEHARKQQRNYEENLAMYSDLLIGSLMAIYVVTRL